MFSFLKKKSGWGEDDEPYLQELKAPKATPADPPKREVMLKKEPVAPSPSKRPVTFSDRQLTVKERLERMQAQEKSQVLQRLESMQSDPRPSPRPLDFVSERKEPQQVRAVPQNQEAPLVNNLDKAIKKLDMLRGKMLKADSYLSLFYELKVAEKEFVDAYNEVQAKDADLPPMMQQKADQLKANLRTQKA